MRIHTIVTAVSGVALTVVVGQLHGQLRAQGSLIGSAGALLAPGDIA